LLPDDRCGFDMAACLQDGLKTAINAAARYTLQAMVVSPNHMRA